MRNVPPAGGAMRLTVRPARSSPVAYTVSLSGPLTTFAVGTLVPRSGITGAAVANVTAMSAIPRRAADHTARLPTRVILFSESGPARDGERGACRRVARHR